MDILVSFAIVICCCLGGVFLGKAGIDALLGADKNKYNRLKVYAIVVFLLIIVAAVAAAEIRIALIISAVLFLFGIPCGFMGWISIGSTLGLKVKWDKTVGSEIKDLVFDETREETGYDLYLPAQKDEGRAYSLILFIHGGGFTGGARKDGAVWCKYFASKGYVSATMDYTLADGKHESNLNLMCDQITACVTAIQKKCEELGYPVTEMATTGGSAGGCLAALYAYKVAEASPIPVKFVFQQTGPMYFDPVYWNNLNNRTAQAEFVKMLTGKEVTEEMVQRNEHYAIVNEVSPIAYITPTSVPMLCAYGPNDKIVPVSLKYLLFDALERNNVTYDFVDYPHSNHGLYDDPKSQREFLAKVDDYCARFFANNQKS